METAALIVFASLFVLSGLNHIRNHEAMVGYTAMSLEATPLPASLAYFGGWTTGGLLIVLGIGAATGVSSLFAYGLAAFLAAATLLFHRNFLQDPGGFKGVSLAGAALFIALNT